MQCISIIIETYVLQTQVGGEGVASFMEGSSGLDGGVEVVSM